MKKYVLGILFLFSLLFSITVCPCTTHAKPKLNKTSLVIQKGNKKKLKVKKKGKKKVRWTSKKKRIASVSKKGVVKAKKVGKTTIIAKVGKRKLRCKVRVIKKKTSSEKTSSKKTDVTSSDYKNYYSTSYIHQGKATYFDGGYVNGCCNLDDIASGFDVVAMNEYDYNNGLLAGAFIEVTGPKGKVLALVTDLLPAAESVRGNLDLNENTFAKIADKKDGIVDVSWRIVALPDFPQISYKFKPESSQYWAQVQVVGHKYPVRKLEYLSKGKYVELPRERYNFFTAQNGFGTSNVTFRVTDIYGHTLTDTVTMQPGKTIAGKQNFPD